MESWDLSPEIVRTEGCLMTATRTGWSDKQGQAGWVFFHLVAGQIAHVVIARENIDWTKRYVVYYIITEWCIPKKQIGPYH